MAIEFGAILKLKDEFSQTLSNATKKTTFLGKSLEGAKKTGALAFKGLIAGSVAAAGMMVASGKKFADFESAMLDMKSVYDPSEIPDNLYKNMMDQAKQLGARTKFSAKEAAEGMKELAAAGMKPEQVMKAIAGTLDLAAAGELSVAAASEIASNSLNMFGLDASKASHVANVLAKGANLGSLSVADMGNSLKYVGPVAAAAGHSIEQVSASLVALSNNGIKGEQGGTVLRGVMANLVAPTKQASQMMSKLGMSVIDSAGKMKPMGDIVEEFRSKTTNMTNAQKVAAAQTLVGKTNMAGFLALVKTGKDNLDSYTKEIEKTTDAAKAMSLIKLGGVAGFYEYMLGSIDGIFIALGDRLAPALVKIFKIVETGADAINGFFQLADAVNLLGNKSQDAEKKFDSFRTSFNQFTGLNFSVADFTTVTQSFAELKKSFFEMTDSVGNAVTTILEPIFNALGIDTTNNVSMITGAFSGLTGVFDILTGAINFLAPIVKFLIEAFMSLVNPIISLVTPSLTTLFGIIQNASPLWNLMGSYIKALASVVGTILGAALSLVIGFTTDLIARFNTLAKVVAPLLVPIFDKIGSAVQSVAKFIGDLIGKTGELITKFSEIKVPSFGSLFGGGKEPKMPNPVKKFSGISNVPKDEMPALLHKGERVLTRDENRRLTEVQRENRPVTNTSTSNTTTNIKMGNVQVASTSGNTQQTIDDILSLFVPQLRLALESGGR